MPSASSPEPAPDCRVYPLPYRPDPGHYLAGIAEAPGLALLDSGRPASARGRFDIASAWPLQTLSAEEGESGSAFLGRLRQALDSLGPAKPPAGMELPFCGGLIGWLGYDFARRLEPVPEQARADLQTADSGLGLYHWALISDHQLQTSQLVFHPACPAAECQRLVRLFVDNPPPETNAPFRLGAPFAAEQTPDAYRQAISRIQDYIAAGDCYQVNYTQRFQAPCQGSAWTAYRKLRQQCPTPFAGYLATGRGALVSLSPERFVRVRERQVETRPIKGTRPRVPQDPLQDRQQAEALCRSAKDRAENLMIVDLLRNDLGRSCAIGSIRVPELFALESYPNVHHLVSSITGTLTKGLDALDLLGGAFPGGSVTGAPKIRAMQIIDELEPVRRNAYCGSLLYCDVRGELDSSITIRTLVIEDQTAYCWGGGGIVMDSEWQAEYQESITKVRILMETLEADLAPVNPRPMESEDDLSG